MKKLGGNIAGLLYEKTKEHPARRYALYWDIPEPLLYWAFMDLFTAGYDINQTLLRMNFTLNYEGREIKRHKFYGFVQACKKYRTWMAAGPKRTRPLPVGRELAFYLKEKSRLSSQDT